MFQAQQRIGHYTLLRKIGQGGFGEVWLAEKRSEFITRQVAIKLPTDDQVDKAAIRREAQLWEQASGHPNVLPIIDADVYDGQMAIVSEYADGGSLADKLKREGKLSVADAVALTVGILHGLEYLHHKRIIHRDIKPANILLQGHTPRLADFGISRAMQTSTISSVIIGTNAYMSPEAFDGARTPQTDIWSVGVTLYQLLTNKLPFPQGNPSERMFAILTQEFEPLPNEIPYILRNAIAQALAKKPASRYQSAQEMRLALQSGNAAATLLDETYLLPTIIAEPSRPVAAKTLPFATPVKPRPIVIPVANDTATTKPKTESAKIVAIDEAPTSSGKLSTPRKRLLLIIFLIWLLSSIPVLVISLWDINIFGETWPELVAISLLLIIWVLSLIALIRYAKREIE